MNAPSTKNQHDSAAGLQLQAAHPDFAAVTDGGLVTLFAIPKPFDGAADLIQRNAIGSWKRLAPELEIILLGDEPGIAEAAKQLGVRHISGLGCNDHGTPRIDSAFSLAHQHSRSPYLLYCNADVILTQDMVRAAKFMEQSDLSESFVAFGRRTDVTVDWPVRFDCMADFERLMIAAQEHGKLSPIVCKEYFLFPRSMYQQVPAFAVGRGNWDNWMIHHARSQQVPVVNMSKMVTAIHQTHDYQHQPGNRLGCYVTGVEARTNEDLAGGKWLSHGSSATWHYTRRGLAKAWFPQLNPDFWADLPRFGSLLFTLFLRR